MLNLFFFSSRRRHTRFKCDWSSDVCSSDLSPAGGVLPTLQVICDRLYEYTYKARGGKAEAWSIRREDFLALGPPQEQILSHVRSEERRVGKECRSRWSPYH